MEIFYDYKFYEWCISEIKGMISYAAWDNTKEEALKILIKINNFRRLKNKLCGY